jgi:uncharacterized protein (UPF0332 family)
MTEDEEEVRAIDFLRTAEELLAAASGKPRQANLKKACSSTYYALFHTLCVTCANMLIGAQGTHRAWTQVYRAVEHRVAKDNCRRREMIERFPVEIQVFASMFAQMQEKRHRADYDPNERLYKSEVASDIVAARASILAFQSVELKHRRAFAAYMILGKPR